MQLQGINMQINKSFFNKTVKTIACITSGLIISLPANSQELLVSAAASLTNALTELGEEFEKQHNTKVINSFAASDVLLQQIVNGAPSNIFASADQTAMDKTKDVIIADTRVNFVQNKVVLIVPSQNPSAIENINDLNNTKVQTIAYGNPASVPVGRYTKGALENIDLWNIVESKQILGENVRQVLDYVARGEVDAGFVFATDAAAMADKVKVITTLETTIPVTYPIAVIKDNGNIENAKTYIEFVMSDKGQQILSKYGFAKPE